MEERRRRPVAVMEEENPIEEQRRVYLVFRLLGLLGMFVLLAVLLLVIFVVGMQTVNAAVVMPVIGACRSILCSRFKIF